MTKHDLDAALGEADAKKGQRNEMRMIARAASILRALADAPAGLSLGQIAKATGLARSTVQRLVGAMEVERLVATEAAVAGVRIGSEIPRIASSAHRDIKLVVHPKLEELHAEVGDTVDLTLMQDGAAVVIDQATSAGRVLRVVSQIGSALPLHCTSNGKAHLAQMSDAGISTLLARPLVRPTANTIVDANLLVRQIEAVRSGECAEDIEEYAEAVCAISVPIVGFGSNYALGVLMPRQRYNERKPLVQVALRKCQAGIQQLVGLR